MERVKEETERVLNENELGEFRSRIALLSNELNDKNRQIEEISKQKDDLERVGEKAMSSGM